MNETIKIIFDECSVSPRVVKELGQFYALDYPAVEMVHLRDKFKLGSKDPDWLGMLKSEGIWIVVSTDKGKSDGQNHHLKPPNICRELKITHVIISKGIDRGGSVAHRQALADVWSMLVKIPLLEKGTKLSLRYQGSGARRAELFVGQRTMKSVLEDKNEPGSATPK